MINSTETHIVELIFAQEVQELETGGNCLKTTLLENACLHYTLGRLKLLWDQIATSLN